MAMRASELQAPTFNLYTVPSDDDVIIRDFSDEGARSRDFASPFRPMPRGSF
jgi:hypothetical protein